MPLTHHRKPFQTITYVLYYLAEKPEFLALLREEIQTSISADGWTGAAMGNMWKLDSILRETLRYHGVSLRKYTQFPPASLLHVHMAN